jgi:segregation and condensation protein A
MGDAYAADLAQLSGAGVSPDAAIPEDRSRRSVAGSESTPVVRLDGFSGSLDLLLELARRHAVDLAAISIRDLVDQFVTILARDDIPMEQRADWLVTASWLAWLKSQLLLPNDKGAAAEQEAEATRDRLLEKARMQAAAAWLSARRPQLGVDVFPRGRPELFARHYTGDVIGLLRACLWLLRRPVDPPPLLQRARRYWRPPQALAQIETALANRPEGAELVQFLPRALVASKPAAATADAGEAERDHRLALRAAIASTLIAALELARCGIATCD